MAKSHMFREVRDENVHTISCKEEKTVIDIFPCLLYKRKTQP
jgi:hypothetical protein